MLISTTAVIKWNSKNKKHYEELGYIYTKMGDELKVKVSDLTNHSKAIVKVRCDYCGHEYDISYDTYNTIHKKTLINKDACRDCCEKKSKDSIELKYGDYSGLYDATRESRTKTNMQRYGCSNPFGNELIKNKIRQYYLDNYNCVSSMQIPETVAKSKSTCMFKYGVSNYGKIYSETHTKDLSPSWKGELAKDRTDRKSAEYRAWRKSVFDRDSYTCKCCGIKNGCGSAVWLEAHHIKNYSSNPDLRFEIENGVTLCKYCHMKFHNEYGNTNNNIEQLQDFFKKFKLDKNIC